MHVYIFFKVQGEEILPCNVNFLFISQCYIMKNSRQWHPTPVLLPGKSHGWQHARLHCPSLSPGVCSNSCPSSGWCHPTISSSVVIFSSRLQSFPASGSFPVSQFFASGGQSIGVSASNISPSSEHSGPTPLGWTGWISLQSKGLSRVFSNTTVQKHQFFGAQLSL